MREILFRGKRLDTGEWVEGACFPASGPYPATIFHGKHNALGEYVEAETVGQFTGLTDRNGKRIFEGDVCRFREWSRGEMCWIGNIHYENQQFVISGGPNKECETPFSLALSRFVSENIEVIGAIYDNSELLEVTPDA